MKWGRKQNLQQQCYSSFGFSLSHSFFPRRWISMMKQSLVSKTTQQQGDAKTKHRDKHPISEVCPPPPPNPVRVTTVSDHLFFSPTSLGHLITREELPRCSCLSCCGGSEEDQHGSNRNRNAGGRRKGCGSFGSGRERPGSNYYSISTHNKECGSGLRRSRSERLDKSVAFPGDVDRSRNKVFELKPVQTKNVRIGKDPDPNDPSQARRKSVSGKIRRRNTIKIKSPRLTVKKKVGVGEGQTTRRTMLKSLESFAVVKSSIDPYKDFRDSMVEMILEQKMTRLEELESLLACYLSLNSEEYHDVIVKVFQQVLFDRRNQIRR